jgi:excisionase family DNA binding protein
MRNIRENLDISTSPGQNGCHVCKDLLANLQRFFDMLENAHKGPTTDWLTVGEIANELKISRSVVYRLIRNGELEAVDLVDTDGKMARKGHYRVMRWSLDQFLESKKIRPLPKQVTRSSHSGRLPKVKNHLGL